MAGTGVTIRIVSNRLPQMPGAIKAALVAEVSRATFDIEAHAKAKAPVKTGTLRRSYHSVFANGGLTGIMGTNLNYARFVEFGTRRASARPHVRPAYGAVMPGFLASVRRALQGLK